MTPQQIVGMAVRIFSIWLIVIAFQLFAVATAMNAQLGGSDAWPLYFMPALPLLMAVFLWLFPMSIAYKLVPRTNDTNKLSMPARQLAAAASVIMGIWVLIGAIPHLVGNAGVAFFSDEAGLSAMYFTQERKLQLLAVVVECAFALFLILKPWSIANRIALNSGTTARDSE